MISYDCAAQLNEIVNHPEVIGGHLVDGIEPPLDVSSSLERGETEYFSIHISRWAEQLPGKQVHRGEFPHKTPCTDYPI